MNFEHRQILCRLLGHATAPWRVKLHGYLHFRDLCLRCGLSVGIITIAQERAA